MAQFFKGDSSGGNTMGVFAVILLLVISALLMTLLIPEENERGLFAKKISFLGVEATKSSPDSDLNFDLNFESLVNSQGASLSIKPNKNGGFDLLIDFSIEYSKVEVALDEEGAVIGVDVEEGRWFSSLKQFRAKSAGENDLVGDVRKLLVTAYLYIQEGGYSNDLGERLRPIVEKRDKHIVKTFFQIRS